MKTDLDREIGEKIFGFEVQGQPGRLVLVTRDGNAVGLEYDRATSYRDCEAMSEQQAWALCPDFSTEIKDAWLIVERVSGKDIVAIVSKLLDGSYVCHLMNTRATINRRYQGQSGYCEWYDVEEQSHSSPAEAICKAALHAYGLGSRFVEETAT